MSPNTVLSFTEIIEKHGSLAVSVILSIALAFVAVKIYKVLMSKIDALNKRIEELNKQIVENKNAYSMRLEGIITEIKQALEKSTAVIAQNNEIIKDLKHWREK